MVAAATATATGPEGSWNFNPEVSYSVSAALSSLPRHAQA